MAFRSRHRDGQPGWALAKAALMIAAGENASRVGFVKHIGSGISRDAFVAEVGDEVLVALVPRADAPAGVDERAVHEAHVVTKVAVLPEQHAFRVARYARAVRVDDRAVLVTEAVSGFALDLRDGRQGSVRPWEVVAHVAAAIHRIDPSQVLPRVEIATRREDALNAARIFDEADRVTGARAKVIAAARAWVHEHLPLAERSSLLHGDLLGQNILLMPGEAPFVIDWEFARAGDPAHDLAIVTRGKRDPFKTGRGIRPLLDEYRSAGGCNIAATDVRLYELCMVTRWFVDAIKSPDDAVHGPEVHLAHVERLLAMPAEPA
jgi:aminoglycoside phosphotransferase (APT) family kinase protein